MSATGSRSDAGATLLEMLVVLGILGLITAMVFPGVVHPLQRMSQLQARAALASNLRLARARAERRGRSVVVDLASDGASYGWDGATVALPTRLRIGGASRSIRFFADGSSSGGRFWIRSDGRADAVVVDFSGRGRSGFRRMNGARALEIGRCRADRGSVLVEAMVSVAIVALMLAVAYRAVGETALRSRAAEQSRTAGLIARSRLAAVGVEAPLEPGRTGGVEDGFAWRVDVEPTQGAASAAGALMRVNVVVYDPRRGAERARITTLRLAGGG